MSVRALFSASALIAIGMMIGRLLGLGREMMLATQFGVSTEGDLAILMLLIPDFVTAAFIGNATSAALLPAFASRTPLQALALFRQSLLLCFGAFSAMTLALYMQRDYLLHQLAQDALPEAALPLSFAFLSIPLSAATAIVTAYLQHRERLCVPAFATALFNAVILAGLWFAPKGLYALGLTIVAAALLRLLAHYIAFLRGAPKERAQRQPWQISGPLLRIYLSATASGLLSLIPFYGCFAIAVMLDGSVAHFNYAFKLLLLPATLCQTIIQMTLMPWLVKQRALGMAAAHRQLMEVGWALSLCMALALCMAASSVVALCFGYGNMMPGDLAVITKLFAIGIWSLPFVVLGALWQTLYFAHEKPTPPLHANIAQAVLIFPLAILGHKLWGTSGILAAFIATQTVALAILSLTARKHRLAMQRFPAMHYFTMTFVAALLWLPLAWGYRAAGFSPAVGLVAAIAIGITLLAATLLSVAEIRHALVKWTRNRA